MTWAAIVAGTDGQPRLPSLPARQLARLQRELQRRREEGMAAAKARKERMLALEEEAKARVRGLPESLARDGWLGPQPRASQDEPYRRAAHCRFAALSISRSICALTHRPQAPPPEGDAARRTQDSQILARAEALIEEEEDEVKLMNRMVRYAQCVTMRDRQIMVRLRSREDLGCVRVYVQLTAGGCDGWLRNGDACARVKKHGMHVAGGSSTC